MPSWAAQKANHEKSRRKWNWKSFSYQFSSSATRDTKRAQFNFHPPPQLLSLFCFRMWLYLAAHKKTTKKVCNINSRVYGGWECFSFPSPSRIEKQRKTKTFSFNSRTRRHGGFRFNSSRDWKLSWWQQTTKRSKNILLRTSLSALPARSSSNLSWVVRLFFRSFLETISLGQGLRSSS